MKKVLSFLFATMLVGQVLAEDFNIGNLKYTITDAGKHEVTISKSDGGWEEYPTGDIVIPATVEFSGVTYTIVGFTSSQWIGAFEWCSGITSVVIPSTITNIERRTFRQCNGLKSVTIPNSVTYIGREAFENCIELSVTIPNSVTYIESDAFKNCCSVTITEITEDFRCEERAFNCVKNVIYSGSSRWWGKGELIVNGIVDGDFIYSDAEKKNLTAYTGKGKTVIIPEGVEKIGRVAFYGCPNITSLTIPSTVTEIDPEAFAYCTELSSITIPESVDSIGNDAFNYVKNIIYSGNAGGCPWGALTVNGTIDCDFIYADAEKTKLTAYIGKGGDVVIPKGVTNIGDDAFYSHYNKKYVPGGSVSIDIGNAQLTSIIIPEGVTSIGDRAFKECQGLTSVTIPNGVASIGEDAFQDCFNLKWVNIANSVTTIGRDAFSTACSTNIIYSGSAEGSPWGAYKVYVNGQVDGDFCYADAEKTRLIGYIGNSTSIVIPENVVVIEENAFYGCSNLTSVTIPNSVTSIGNFAFNGCSGLSSVTIPNSVTSIGDLAFCDCRGLTSVNIPNSVTSLEQAAFAGCEGLTSVTIPNSVTKIGNYVFHGCSGLTSIAIPKSVTTVGDNVFLNCSNLTIQCEAKEKPEGWSANWNPDNRPVVWGAATLVTESAANSINIYARCNTIIVENAPEEICVYDAMGRLVCRDARSCISTKIRVNTTGLYIVKVGNVAKRVMVN